MKVSSGWCTGSTRAATATVLRRRARRTAWVGTGSTGTGTAVEVAVAGRVLVAACSLMSVLRSGS
jgi:hypothetical protein